MKNYKKLSNSLKREGLVLDKNDEKRLGGETETRRQQIRTTKHGTIDGGRDKFNFKLLFFSTMLFF